MSASYIDRIAEALHDGWWAAHRDAGHTLGPERNREKKTHPHLVPWSACGLENNNQDRFMAALIIEYLRTREREAPGYRPTDEELGEQIHNAFAEYAAVERPGHPEIGKTWQDHEGLDRAVHLAQAAHVLRMWETRPWKETK